MPCKPAKARHLLRDGKARVVRRTPFTIQLTIATGENVQRVYKNFCGYSEIITKKGVPHETRTGSV